MVPVLPLSKKTAPAAPALRGCVPKKLLVFGAAFSAEVEDAAGFGWDTGQPDDWGHDWGQLISRKNAELDRLSGIYTSLLENAGVEIIAGRGVVRDAHTVAVAGVSLPPNVFLLLSGWPSMPPIPVLPNMRFLRMKRLS